MKSHQHQHQHLAGQAIVVVGGGDGHSIHSMENRTAAAFSAATSNTSHRMDMTEDGAQVIVYFIRPDPIQLGSSSSKTVIP